MSILLFRSSSPFEQGRPLSPTTSTVTHLQLSPWGRIHLPGLGTGSANNLPSPKLRAWRIREFPLSVSAARSVCLCTPRVYSTGFFSFPFRVYNFHPLCERVIRLPSIGASPARSVMDAYIFYFLALGAKTCLW